MISVLYLQKVLVKGFSPHPMFSLLSYSNYGNFDIIVPKSEISCGCPCVAVQEGVCVSVLWLL